MIKIISLFSGAGGLDLGFERVGFYPIIAYDKDEAAVKTYNFNRGYKVARLVDLLAMESRDIVNDISKLNIDGPIRGVLGGPPCQYFSNGNKSKRDENDPRRKLPKHFAILLRDINSTYNIDFFVFENVLGLTQPKHVNDLNIIKNLFEDAGFNVFTEILDAYNFNIPQKRKRVFLVGWNKSLYPEMEYKFPIGTPSGLTVADEIKGLEEPEFWSRDLDPEFFPEHPNHWTMNPKSKKFSQNKGKNVRPYSRSFRTLSWDKPSYTVAYGHNEIHVHPAGHRRLSIYEAMLLQGFPKDIDGYQLIGNLTEQVTLISDAVPPPLSEALAKSIKVFLK